MRDISWLSVILNSFLEGFHGSSLAPPEQPTIEAARIYRDGLSNHWSAYKIVE